MVARLVSNGMPYYLRISNLFTVETLVMEMWGCDWSTDSSLIIRPLASAGGGGFNLQPSKLIMTYISSLSKLLSTVKCTKEIYGRESFLWLLIEGCLTLMFCFFMFYALGFRWKCVVLWFGVVAGGLFDRTWGTTSVCNIIAYSVSFGLCDINDDNRAPT